MQKKLTPAIVLAIAANLAFGAEAIARLGASPGEAVPFCPEEPSGAAGLKGESWPHYGDREQANFCCAPPRNVICN